MNRATFLALTASIVVPRLSLFAKESELMLEYLGTTDKQKELIRYLYKEGKQYGLSKTLVVIAWTESSFGIQLSNKLDPRCGGVLGLSYYHTAIRHFKLNHAVDPTQVQLKYVKDRLHKDIDFSIKHSVIHLQRGIKKFGKDWLKVWAFYNGGYKHWDSEDAHVYVEEFVKKIKVINKVGIL